MGGPLRQVRVDAFAKINLCLEVLGKRPDGYHDLRTIFQTISLSDVMDVEFVPATRSRVELASTVEIPNNLAARAAEAFLEATGVTGEVKLRLRKRIPMGGGLGGGSADAAAVLRALPLLSGCALPLPQLFEIATALGSDVPFFLLGGTALGLGRGTELYPLANANAEHVLLLTPPIHSSTAEAYASLARTGDYHPENDWSASTAQALAGGTEWGKFAVNDFEEAIFATHPAIAQLHKRLEQAGARPARMTGSGAALFGVFDTAEKLVEARRLLADVPSHAVHFVSGRKYRASISDVTRRVN